MLRIASYPIVIVIEIRYQRNNPMSEIISLPASVREQIEEARQLALQNQHEEACEVLTEAQETLREMGKTLAHSHPELCALLLARQLGHRQIIAVDAEIDTLTVTRHHELFGFRIGKEVTTTTNTKTRQRTLRLD
ncbi:MAG: hypothetical protein ACYC96_13320 [Fimbriimonadaceae bacterium]